MDQVKLDYEALDELLNSPDGPVGLVIEELSDKAAVTARLFAPVMKRRNLAGFGKYFNPEKQYGPFGATKASVRSAFPRFNEIGQMYGGVNVNYGPTLFLQRPARQIHTTVYRFMSTALDGAAL